MSNEQNNYRELAETEDKLFQEHDEVLTSQPSEEDLEKVREYFRNDKKTPSRS